MESRKLLIDLAFSFPERELIQDNGDLGCKTYNYAVKLENQKKEQDAFNFYNTAVKLGSVEAKYAVGVCYYEGIGCKKNELEGFKYFQEARDGGDLNAIYALAICFLLEEELTNEEKSIALTYFKELWKKEKYIDAIFALGACYTLGIGVKKDVREGMRYLEDAKEKGSARATEYFKKVEEQQEQNKKSSDSEVSEKQAKNTKKRGIEDEEPQQKYTWHDNTPESLKRKEVEDSSGNRAPHPVPKAPFTFHNYKR